MYVYVYVRMYFLLPKHCSADYVWIREAEARAQHEDSPVQFSHTKLLV